MASTTANADASPTLSATPSPSATLVGKCYHHNRSSSTTETTTSTSSPEPTAEAPKPVVPPIAVVPRKPKKAPKPEEAPKPKENPPPVPAKPKENPHPEQPRDNPKQQDNPHQHPRQPEKPNQSPEQAPKPKPEVYPPPQEGNDLPALARDCLDTLNRARSSENGAPALKWDSYLADRAQNSAQYCANVAQQHSDVIGGQILFITKTSCSAGIKGWFYDEKPYGGGHYRIIKNERYKRVGCAVIQSGSRCISCNFQ